MGEQAWFWYCSGLKDAVYFLFEYWNLQWDLIYRSSVNGSVYVQTASKSLRFFSSNSEHKSRLILLQQFITSGQNVIKKKNQHYALQLYALFKLRNSCQMMRILVEYHKNTSVRALLEKVYRNMTFKFRTNIWRGMV